MVLQKIVPCVATFRTVLSFIRRGQLCFHEPVGRCYPYAGQAGNEADWPSVGFNTPNLDKNEKKQKIRK